MKRILLPLLYAAFLLMALSACQLGKHYSRPDLHLPAADASAAVDSAQPSIDSLQLADRAWWTLYTDTTLQALIRQTLEHNKDMRITTVRLREAAALKRIDWANFFPQVNATAYAQKEGSNYGGDNYKNDPEYGAKLTAQWEIDVWGNLRWARDRSTAQFLASLEAQHALRMSLVAQVAQAYFELLALDNELNIVQHTQQARREGMRLARIRFEGGLTSETSYQQARVELARTNTLIPELERKITLKENEIALLAGNYPTRIARNAEAVATLPYKTLPVQLPSTLLERRPDVRQAEQLLIAANAKVGLSYTNMFPRLTLTTNYGLESEELADLLKSPIHFISGNLLSPIFAWGKHRARLKADKAAYEAQCYAYEKVVITAFHEAYNALVNFNKMEEIYTSRLQLEQSSKAAMELAQLQYINGVIGYLDLLDVQRSYFDAQLGLSNAIRDKQIATITLYKALGGGWTENSPAFLSDNTKKMNHNDRRNPSTQP